MEIEYELTLDDLLEYNIFHMQHSPSVQRSIATLRYVGTILIVFVTIVIGYNNFKSQTSFLLKFLPMLPGLFIAVWCLLFYKKEVWRNWKKRTERLFKEGNLKDTIGKKYLILTQEEIIGKSTSSEIKTQWSGVEKIVETDRQILIYYGSLRAFVIPKRAFSDEAKCSEFIETVKKFHADAAREK